jgi:hypothetical protein
MEKLPLPPDFKDFLQLLNLEKVEHRLVSDLGSSLCVLRASA